MILFFIGIIEMAIAAAWTRYVSRAKVFSTGLITCLNIFIWYYVIQQVVNHIDSWLAIAPYAGGCAIGAMLGAMGPKDIRRIHRTCRKLLKRTFAVKTRRRKKTPRAEEAEAQWDNAYEHLG